MDPDSLETRRTGEDYILRALFRSRSDLVRGINETTHYLLSVPTDDPYREVVEELLRGYQNSLDACDSCIITRKEQLDATGGSTSVDQKAAWDLTRSELNRIFKGAQG